VNELALFAGKDMNWKSSEYARAKAKAWRLENPERVAQYRAKNRRKSYLQEAFRKYGITAEQFHELMNRQKDSCATCCVPFDWSDRETKPHIDHCHVTLKVRGILCKKCNSVLGMVKDNAKTLLNLAEYLGK
jgi:hypothetical protein